MYTPRSFRIDDLATLHGLIRRYNFATLFLQGREGPSATHLPFMLDAEHGESGTLIAHMARANPQWRSFDGRSEVLVAFLGPHAYISPAWYADPVTVPTWNYAAVHVYGIPRIVDDPAVVRAQLERLVRIHEEGRSQPWNVRLADGIMDALVEAVVAFEIPIDRLEGKYKFNQNRSREDQAGVVAVLEQEADPTLRAVAEIMTANLGQADPGPDERP